MVESRNGNSATFRDEARPEGALDDYLSALREIIVRRARELAHDLWPPGTQAARTGRAAALASRQPAASGHGSASSPAR
jgi:hypothetical protein